MPAVSKKQQRFFGYLLSNPDERKKRGISKKSAKDFAQDIKEATREEAEKKRLAKDNPDDYAVRNIGHGKWSTKRKSSMKGQAKRRGEGLKNVDSDLPSKSKERGEAKTKKIVGREKEHHHLTPISQSTKEFKGLSPEQRKAKREKDAKQHKYHGSDPRNLAQAEGPKGGKGIPHRGEGGYHSKQKAVGSGGEGKDFGSEAQILAVKRRKASRERKQNEEVVYEVAPPGWGHTKAEKEKTKPWKPKSKIGGSAAAFDRARKEGRFKGSKADMFKLMWWMKNKGGKPKGKPHYKPGTDEKYKKYQDKDETNEEVKATYSGSNVTFSQFYNRAREAMADSKRKKEKELKNREQSAKTREDTRKHGIKFTDSKGSGRIKGGKKVYD